MAYPPAEFPRSPRRSRRLDASAWPPGSVTGRPQRVQGATPGDLRPHLRPARLQGDVHRVRMRGPSVAGTQFQGMAIGGGAELNRFKKKTCFL